MDVSGFRVIWMSRNVSWFTDSDLWLVNSEKLPFLCLMKTFVVETLYYCNLLCYVKCSTSLLTFAAVALSLYHFKTYVSCTPTLNWSAHDCALN